MIWCRICLVLVLATGCRERPGPAVAIPADQPTPVRPDEPPVPLNPDPPVGYPAGLAAQRIGGVVILGLFVDSAGIVRPESTTVQESSGYPALDSAALAGGPRFRYAPALRDGRPVARAFLQPVTFRAPGRSRSPE